MTSLTTVRAPASIGALVPLILLTLWAVLAVDFMAAAGGGDTAPTLVFAPRPPKAGLVTNEYAYHHPRDPRSVLSTQWVVTSGSLFSDGSAYTTGVLDHSSPDPASRVSTNSAVFRAVSVPSDFADVTVSLRLRIDGYSSSGAGLEYDGVHVFLRYQNPQELYAVSVVRRDGIVVVKKKMPGGPSNGGTYVTLASVRRAVAPGRWVSIATSARTLPDRAVQIVLAIDGRRVIDVNDNGRLGGPPIYQAGRVGLRGDDTSFTFSDFRAEAR